jgi:hypothetical protein
MFTKKSTGNGSRKRARTNPNNDDHAGGGGGDDCAQLRAHGYEVKPEVIMDDNGGEWEPLFKVLATLFYLLAMLMLNPRGRIIFSPCIDPWT